MEEYLKDRITHLNKCDKEYWDKSYDESYPKFERDYYRICSKEFEARRKELEMFQDFLKNRK